MLFKFKIYLLLSAFKMFGANLENKRNYPEIARCDNREL